MKLSPIPACAAALLLAGSAEAQTDHTFHIDGPASHFTWSATTSLGDVNEDPNNFDLDGTAIVSLDATLTSGQMVGGLAYSIPDLITGVVPNPLPFLPPLAEFELIDAAFETTTDPFTIDANGDFDADFTLVGAHGTFIVCVAGFETVTPVTDLISDPTPVSGTITTSGNLATITIPLNNLVIAFDDPVTGLGGSVVIDGTVTGETDLVDGLMTLEVPTLSAGTQGSFTVTGGDATTSTYLIYSTTGPRNWTTQGLDIGIDNPVIASGPDDTDANGDITWSLPIPAGAAGLTAWIQAVQVSNNASNVVVTTVN